MQAVFPDTSVKYRKYIEWLFRFVIIFEVIEGIWIYIFGFSNVEDEETNCFYVYVDQDCVIFMMA